MCYLIVEYHNFNSTFYQAITASLCCTLYANVRIVNLSDRIFSLDRINNEFKWNFLRFLPPPSIDDDDDDDVLFNVIC